MGKANPENEITRLQAELDRAHETITRLNRRCQSAERGLAAKLNPGPRTFGRILANSAATMWHAWALEMARGILAKEITIDVLDNARQIVNETAGKSYADLTNELHAKSKLLEKSGRLAVAIDSCLRHELTAADVRKAVGKREYDELTSALADFMATLEEPSV